MAVSELPEDLYVNLFECTCTSQSIKRLSVRQTRRIHDTLEDTNSNILTRHAHGEVLFHRFLREVQSAQNGRWISCHKRLKVISIPVLYVFNGTPPLVPPLLISLPPLLTLAHLPLSSLLLISPPPHSCSSPPLPSSSLLLISPPPPPSPPHSCSSPPLLTYHHLPSLCPSFASSTCPVVSPVSQVEAVVVYETNRHTDTTNKMSTYIYMCTYYITIYNPTRATYIVGQQLCRQNYCNVNARQHCMPGMFTYIGSPMQLCYASLVPA